MDKRIFINIDFRFCSETKWFKTETETWSLASSCTSRFGNERFDSAQKLFKCVTCDVAGQGDMHKGSGLSACLFL